MIAFSKLPVEIREMVLWHLIYDFTPDYNESIYTANRFSVGLARPRTDLTSLPREPVYTTYPDPNSNTQKSFAHYPPQKIFSQKLADSTTSSA